MKHYAKPNRRKGVLMISFLIGFALGAWLGFALAAIMVVRSAEKRKEWWKE